MSKCRIKLQLSRAYRPGPRGTREKSSENFGIPVRFGIVGQHRAVLLDLSGRILHDDIPPPSVRAYPSETQILHHPSHLVGRQPRHQVAADGLQDLRRTDELALCVIAGQVIVPADQLLLVHVAEAGVRVEVGLQLRGQQVVEPRRLVDALPGTCLRES